MGDVIPDLEVALKSKNPQVKEGTMKFLGRALTSSKTPIPPAQVKPLAETLALLLEDSFEGARNEAATCFGTLMKMVGERPLNATMESIAELRKSKIKEAFEKATVKCKAGGPAPVKAQAAAPPKKPVTKLAPKEEKEEGPVPKKSAVTAKPPPKPAVCRQLFIFNCRRF